MQGWSLTASWWWMTNISKLFSSSDIIDHIILGVSESRIPAMTDAQGRVNMGGRRIGETKFPAPP
jgi:hypothetical protein